MRERSGKRPDLDVRVKRSVQRLVFGRTRPAARFAYDALSQFLITDAGLRSGARDHRKLSGGGCFTPEEVDDGARGDQRTKVKRPDESGARRSRWRLETARMSMFLRRR